MTTILTAGILGTHRFAVTKHFLPARLPPGGKAGAHRLSDMALIFRVPHPRAVSEGIAFSSAGILPAVSNLTFRFRVSQTCSVAGIEVKIAKA